MNKLLEENIERIEWTDPHINKALLINKYNYNKKKIYINSKNLRSFDIVLLMTDHDKFDYDLIYKNSKAIIDCRGRYEVDNKVTRA
jgi:UDP-N-acetyl-D-glucosamine dehydrogenase